jgi:hypothetical protein
MIVRMKPLAVFLLLLCTLPAPAAYDGAPDEKEKWVAFCVDGLKDTGERISARRVYCRCMSEVVDTADYRRLYEWEQMFPPAHRGCYDDAGFKPPAN